MQHAKHVEWRVEVDGGEWHVRTRKPPRNRDHVSITMAGPAAAAPYGVSTRRFVLDAVVLSSRP